VNGVDDEGHSPCRGAVPKIVICYKSSGSEVSKVRPLDFDGGQVLPEESQDPSASRSI
jgi:hypothetical protein